MNHQSELAVSSLASAPGHDAEGLVNDVHSLVGAMSTVRGLLDIDVQNANIHELSRHIADTMVTFPGFDCCRVLLTTELGGLECRAHARTPAPAVDPERPEDSVAAYESGARFRRFPQIDAAAGDGFDPRTATFSTELRMLDAHRGLLQVHLLMGVTEVALIRPLMVLCGRLVEKLYETSNLIHTLDQAVALKTRELSERGASLLREIEERKRTQQIVDLERRRLVDFAEVAADWFWETDERLRFTYISGRFETLSGMSRSSLMGVTLPQFVNLVRGSGWQGCIDELKQKRAFKNLTFMSKLDERRVSVFNLCGKPGYDCRGNFVGYRGIGQDITRTHTMSEELAYHAQHDALTGLENRREFEHCLSTALAQSCMDGSTSVLCYLDLDQFKVINDTCGHSAGDELLCQVAQILKENTRDGDVVARLGGDEFGLLLRPCALDKGAEKAHHLCKTIARHRFVWEDNVFAVGVSIGVIPITRTSVGVGEILSAVDTACYMAKHNGRGRIHVEDENSTELIQWRRDMEWVSKINWALEHDRFEFYQQPIVAVEDTGRDAGLVYEVLLRMKSDTGETIMPAVFLPAAEQYSMMTKIDYWVVDHIIKWLADHPDHLDALDMCCVNLSGHSISDADFMTHLSQNLRAFKVPAKKICLEVTETALISDLRKTRRLINQLRDHGCRFALDDFGSGVSSFAYLKDLPVDFVKIDGIFARDLDEKPENLEILRTINEVSHAMGKQTIAEYVEKASTLASLRDIGVDYVQGYALGRPRKLMP